MNAVAGLPPTVVVVGPMVMALLVVEWRRRSTAARERAVRHALPQVVDQLVLALRSGSTVRDACLATRPVPMSTVGVGGRGATVDVMAPVREALLTGRPLVEAATTLSGHSDTSVRLLSVTIRVLAATGGPAVPALQRLRLTVVGAVHGERRVEAEAGQALASASLLAVAPGLFALTVAAVEPTAAEFYLWDPLGVGAVAVAVALTAVGRFWMVRAVTSLVKPDRRGGRPDVGPDRARRRPVMAGATVIVAGCVVGLAVGFAAGCVVGLAGGVVIERWRRRADLAGAQRTDGALGGAVDLIAVVLGSGGTVRQAVETVAAEGPAPVASVFADVLHLADRDRLLADALLDAADRVPVAAHPLIGVLVGAERDGAPVGSVLQRLADDADQARRMRAELVARRLPVALMTPLVTCLLPAAAIGTVLPLIVLAVRRLPSGLVG